MGLCCLFSRSSCRKPDFERDIKPAFDAMELEAEHRIGIENRYVKKTQTMIHHYKTLSRRYSFADAVSLVVTTLSPIVFGIISRIDKTDPKREGFEYGYEIFIAIGLLALVYIKRKSEEYTRQGLMTEALVSEGWAFVTRTGRYKDFAPMKLLPAPQKDDAVRRFLGNLATLYSIYVRQKFKGKKRNEEKDMKGKPKSGPEQVRVQGQTLAHTLERTMPPGVSIISRPGGQVLVDVPMEYSHTASLDSGGQDLMGPASRPRHFRESGLAQGAPTETVVAGDLNLMEEGRRGTKANEVREPVVPLLEEERVLVLGQSPRTPEIMPSESTNHQNPGAFDSSPEASMADSGSTGVREDDAETKDTAARPPSAIKGELSGWTETRKEKVRGLAGAVSAASSTLNGPSERAFLTVGPMDNPKARALLSHDQSQMAGSDKTNTSDSLSPDKPVGRQKETEAVETDDENDLERMDSSDYE